MVFAVDRILQIDVVGVVTVPSLSVVRTILVRVAHWCARRARRHSLCGFGTGSDLVF